MFPGKTVKDQTPSQLTIISTFYCVGVWNDGRAWLLEVTMEEIRHCWIQRLCNDEKLLDHNFPNHDIISLENGKLRQSQCTIHSWLTIVKFRSYEMSSVLHDMRHSEDGVLHDDDDLSKHGVSGLNITLLWNDSAWKWQVKIAGRL